MKKRIVGLLLVVVMLVLSLASCGYNYSKDDLSQYGSFDKAGFEAAVKALSVEDGDFTADKATREKKVIDAIYKEFATKAGTTDKKTEGKPGAHDVLYYCYYATAKIDGVDCTFVTDFLVNSSGTVQEKSVQLGLGLPSDMEAKVLEAIKVGEFDITAVAFSKVTANDTATESVDESKAAAGQIAYITYTYSYTETVDGKEKEVKGTVTKDRVVLDANNPIHKNLIGKTIGTAVSEFKDDKGTADNTKDDISYTGAKVEWVEKGAELTTFTEKTYTGETEVKKTDTQGVSRKLNDVELTYHIYPVSYVAVEEFNATNLFNTVFGSSTSYATVCQMLFGYDFAEKSEEDRAALVDAYKFTEGDKEITLETFIENLNNLQKTYSTEKTDLTKAETELDKAESSLKTAIDKVLAKATEDEKKALTAAEEALAAAKKVVADAGANATQAQKDDVTAKETAYNTAKTAAYSHATSDERGAVTTAEKALETAKTAVNDATTALDTAKQARDEKVTALLKVKEDMETKITKGYTDYTYEKLEAEYNKEVKMNLATEVYKLLEKHVTINSLPEKAVDEAYDQLIENYEFAFYKNDTLESDDDGEDGEASNKDDSYYHMFKGSFKNFLIKCVVPNEYGKTVDTYKDAKAAVREGAEKMVKPVLMIYLASEAYDIVIDNKEFKERAEEDSQYIVNEAYYGGNTVRNTYQFDDLMNHVLVTEEANDTEDARFTKVTYKNITAPIKKD